MYLIACLGTQGICLHEEMSYSVSLDHKMGQLMEQRSKFVTNYLYNIYIINILIYNNIYYIYFT